MRSSLVCRLVDYGLLRQRLQAYVAAHGPGPLTAAEKMLASHLDRPAAQPVRYSRRYRRSYRRGYLQLQALKRTLKRTL